MEAEKERCETALSKFSSSLDELEDTVRPVLTAIDNLRSAASDDELDAMSRSQLHITLCYTTNVLFCMYLRTQGIDPLVHPVVDEITRVQEAFMRMRKVEAGLSADHQPMPERDRRRHIETVKKNAAKLATLVFPEEGDMLMALYKQKKRQRVTNADSDEENGGNEGCPEPDDDRDLAHVRNTKEDLDDYAEILKKKEEKSTKKRSRKEHLKSKKEERKERKEKRRRKSSK